LAGETGEERSSSQILLLAKELKPVLYCLKDLDRLCLDEEEQIDIDAVVGLLEEKGPHLPYPYSSDVKGTKYGSLRELRIQHRWYTLV